MRNPNRVTSFLLIVLLATIVTSAATLFGQRQPSRNTQVEKQKTRSKDREGKDFETQFPTIDLETPEPDDPDKRFRNKAKNKRYDSLDLVSQQPSESIDETVIENHWQEGVAGLPIAQSHIIVIGEVLTAASYLSNDKKGVYTEFSVRTDEILKSDSPALISSSILSVDRPGGFVRYPGGHKILYRIFGLNMLRANKQYLLFLNNTEQSPNYHVITGYEMTTNGISPIDVAPQFDAYKGMDRLSFVQAVRDAIEQTSQVTPH